MTKDRCTDTNLGDKDTPEKRPDDVSKVQQYHVFKEQSWKSKLGHKVPQTFRLALCDDICSVGWRKWPETHKQTMLVAYLKRFWQTGAKNINLGMHTIIGTLLVWADK